MRGACTGTIRKTAAPTPTARPPLTVAAALLLTTAAVPLCAAGQEPGGPHVGLPEVEARGETGPNLLLIPCAGCRWRSFERFMDAYQDRYRIVAVTLPGYGGSPRPDLPLWTADTPFQDNAVAQLSALLDERGLEDVTVVGASFGSLIGLRLATERPDVVTALVNLDGSPVNPADRAHESAAERFQRARDGIDEPWLARLQDPEEWRAFNAARSLPDEASGRLHHGMFAASDRVAMIHYWRENRLRDRNPDFRALRARYLDVKALRASDANPDSTLAAHNRSMDAAGRPQDFTQVVMYDTSHWIHIERPAPLERTLAAFLRGEQPVDVGPFEMGEIVRSGRGGRDVILMPCLGCDWRSWDAFMKRNGERYRMWALTWPGLGETALPVVQEDPTGTPYFDYLVEALLLLIRREGMERPVLVGHSAAAVLAVRFAHEHPNVLGGVVNVDAVIANRDTYGFTPDERRAWADEEMADVLSRYDDPDAWRALNAPPSGMPAERSQLYGGMWLLPDRENVFAYWRDWLRTDAGVILPDLRVPLLAVHALPEDPERARAARADVEARYRAAPLPVGAAVRFVERSGHTIWEYRPEAFDRILAEFVSGSPLPG